MSEQPHPTLTADYINAFPDGTRDNSSYQDVEEALDQAGAPSQEENGKWLTLPERIAALAKILARPRIVAAAVQLKGVTLSMPRPARHCHIVNALCDPLGAPENTPYAAPQDQGFLTNEAQFAGRATALRIAREARQLKSEPPGNELFTENLW